MFFFGLMTALWVCVPSDAAPSELSDIELVDLQGQAVSLSAFQDQPLLAVVFLGTKCPLAKLYARRLNELADDYRSRGVTFLAINSNAADSQEDINHFASEHDLRFPILSDKLQLAADA